MTPARRPADRLPVVLLVGDGPPARGGVATFLELLAAELDAAPDVEVRVLNTTRRAVWRGGRLTLHAVRRALGDALRVRAAARDADIVHLQTALLPLLPLVRTVALATCAKWVGARVICHAHTGRLNEGPHESFRPGRITRTLLRRLGSVDLIVAVCRAEAAGLSRQLPLAPVAVVDNGVDVERFGPGPDAAGRSASGTPTILYVGALARRKGLLDLLEALRILEERGCRKWRLEVLGGATQWGEEEAERVRAAFRAAGRGDCLKGETGPEGVRAALASADVFVLPSHSEGQPIAVLEAMASGLPVVATEVGGIPDLVRHEVDGLIVAPGAPEALADALERMVSAPRLRSAMGAGARERAAASFTTAHLSASVRRLYALVLAGRAASLRSDRAGGVGGSGIPGDPGVRGIPDVSGIPGVSGIPSVCGVPGVRDVSGVPGDVGGSKLVPEGG